MYFMTLNNLQVSRSKPCAGQGIPSKGSSGSTFLNVGDALLLDSPATGPWLIVSETGRYMVIVLFDIPP